MKFFRRKYFLLIFVIILLTVNIVHAVSRIDDAINWAQSKKGENGYEGWCQRFVSDAYQIGAKTKITRYASAKAAATALDAKKNKDKPIPRGAFVFFTLHPIYGHVGLSLGNGMMIHAHWNKNVGIEITEISKFSSYYIGWAYPQLDPPLNFSSKNNTPVTSHSSNPHPVSTFPLSHIGWLDSHTHNPHSTYLATGDFGGGSPEGVYLATNSPDQDIHYYFGWNGNQIHQEHALNHLFKIEGRGRQIQAMASGKFDGNKKYLAVAYHGSDLVYFYYNNQRIGVVDTHGGRPQVTQLAAGDVDRDGKDELLVATSSDDHIYMFDDWHQLGQIGFTLNKIENNWLDAHGGNPTISALACMDIDGNGYDELLVATDVDDHIYEYFYVGSFDRKGRRIEVNFYKQGYINGVEKSAKTRAMTVGRFKGPEGIQDYLAVITSGSKQTVYFYWQRNLKKAWGGLLSKNGSLSSPDGKPLIHLAAGEINSQSEGEELILATAGNDHINFFGDKIGGAGGSNKTLFDAKLISQSDKNILLTPGQEKELWIEYQNTGEATWFSSEKETPDLITDTPIKRNSIFTTTSWKTAWKPTSLSKAEISPGEKIKYQFKIKAPDTSGKYQEFFALYNGQENNLYKNSKVSFEIIVDGEPPTKAQNLRGDTEKSFWQNQATPDPTPSFKWDSAQDSLSGLAGYYVAIDDPTPEGNGNLDFWIGNQTFWTAPKELQEGWHILALASRDKAGNVNPQDTNQLGDAPYLKFLIDLTPPNQAKNLKLSKEHSTWIETKEGVKITNDSTPTFSWDSGADELSGLAGYFVAIDDSNPDGKGDLDFQIDNQTSWTPSSELSEGKHTVYLTARDKVGHVASNPLSYSFIIDRTAPSGSIQINNGATYTKETEVTLSLSAQDESPIVEYRLSNDGKHWQTYLPDDLTTLNLDLSWNLENSASSTTKFDGTKTVYVQFKDALGHTSIPFSDSIYLDTISPSSWINDLATWQNTLSFVVSWFGQDHLSGIRWFNVQVKDSTTNTWTDWLTKTTLTSKIFEGLDGIIYWFRSKAEDLAGNWEAYPEEADTQTQIDITAPDAPIISSPERNSTLNKLADENENLDGIQITVTGTAEAKANITLMITDQDTNNTDSYSTQVDENGSWSVPNVTLYEGENVLKATAKDAAGNSNTSGGYKIFLDTIAPVTISDLTISSTTYHSLTIEWTAPGDDKDSGIAKTYDIRYSNSEITEANFNTANQIANPPLPEKAGTHQIFIIDNLDPKETYYVAIKTSDEAKNWSGISNVESAQTPTSADKITLIAQKDTLTAEGEEKITLTAIVYDPEGNTGPKLSGEPVSMAITDDNGLPDETGNLSTVTDHGNGTYTAIYTAATKVGDGKITITAQNPNCASQKTASRNINLIPGDPAGSIDLSANPNTLAANGSSTSTITSDIIRDKTGNQVADGQKITVSTDLGSIISPDQDLATAGIQILTSNGKIQFTLKSSVWNGYGQSSTKVNINAQSVTGTASGSTQIIFRDVTPPSIPQLEKPTNGEKTNNNRPTISGRAEKNSRVLIYKKKEGESWVYHYYTYANSEGKFSYTPGSAFSDGNWSFRIRARDAASNTSAYSNPVSITIDTVKPKITGFGPTGTIYHRKETIWATYQDTGTGIDTNRIVLKINGVKKPAQITSSKVSYQTTFPEANRTYNVSIEIYDKAGNKNTRSWQFSIQLASYFLSAIDSTYRTSIVPNWPNTKGLISSPNWWDPGFNDSSWSKKIYKANPAPISVPLPDPQSIWIWANSKVNPNETSLLRKRFSIPSGVTIDDAAIRMSADNEAWAFVGYINGVYFGKVPEALTGQNPYTFGLKDLIRAGQNLLAIQVSNGADSRAGFAFTMTVRYHD